MPTTIPPRARSSPIGCSYQLRNPELPKGPQYVSRPLWCRSPTRRCTSIGGEFWRGTYQDSPRLEEMVAGVLSPLTRADATSRAEGATAPKTVAKALGKETAATLLAVLAESTPIATPDLVKKVVGLQWAGMSSDDLGEGIQPFSIVLPDYAHSDIGLEAQRLAQTYDIMADSGTTTTLQDATVVKTTKVNIPVDFSEARAHLVVLMIVWSVLLGDQHPFVQSYGEFLRTYSGREYSYQTKLRNLGTAAPPAPLLLRHIQHGRLLIGTMY